METREDITIIKARKHDLEVVVKVASLLFDDAEKSELTSEYEHLFENRECAVFLAMRDNEPIGFAQCQLRHDYVEGTHTSPVGYLEGIYVLEDYRCHDIASDLLDVCEKWAYVMGCREFASDAEIENNGSIVFHLKRGFVEVNRIVCFKKEI